MNFYKIVTRKTRSIGEHKEMVDKCREYASELYLNFDEKAIVFVLDMTEFACTLVAVVKSEIVNECRVEKLVDEFNKVSGLDLTIKNSEEIALGMLKHYLRRAESIEYIEDRDKIISDFNLECDCEHQEFVTCSLTKRKIKDVAQELLYDKSLIPELDRIYQVKNESGKIHHPVHYIVRSDDDEYQDIVDCLIAALHVNGRLFSRRYSRFEVHENMFIGIRGLNRLYSIQEGGTVVIKVEPAKDAENSFRADEVSDLLEKISRVINKFSQNVLTIFVMPQICENETDTVYKCMDAVFVEISPENASGERARKYLAYKAKKAEVSATDSLFAGIDDEKALTSSELSEHFSDWYSKHIRTEMYPQYAEMKKKKISDNDKRFGKALRDLEEMIGISDAKKIVYNALDYYKVQKLYKQFGKKKESLSMHMVFTGNPGTAKTTVARLFAQILKDNDVITNGRLIEVGRAELVGKYVGHTAPLVKQAFDAAEGGVLFIDEAYSLLDDRAGMYGDEAINTIVQEMENRRNNTIVIFAGYPKEMEEFLNRNPGLRSRIAFHVPFDDYSSEELVEIAKLMAKNKENKLCEDAVAKLGDIFEMAVKTDDFGNGRYARNIMEKAELNRASRLAKLSSDEVTREMLETFVPDDFEADMIQKTDRKMIGFMRQTVDL